MQFDELVLGEDEYPQGPCESKQEWLLMYSSGVPAPVIARWCRVNVRRVRRAIARKIRQDPRWFDRCLLIHDQPRPGTPAERRPTRNKLWREHYDAVAAYRHIRNGALPRQNDSPHARTLYLWIRAQRHQYDLGNLTQDQITALDQLGEWRGTRLGGRDALWEQRLEEVKDFLAITGRLPRYYPETRGTNEYVLGVWIGTQQTRLRKDRLRGDRRERLDSALPGWI